VIIDAHAHVFPPSVIARREELVATESAFAEIYANPDAKMATAADVLASMDAAGVDRTIICNFTWKSEDLIDETNEYMLNEAIRAGGRLIPFVAMSFAGAGRHGGVDAEESVGGATVGEARSKTRQLAAAGARGIGELRPESIGFNLANSDEADLIAWSAAAFDLPVLVHASEPVGHLYPGKRGLALDALCTFATQSPGVTIIAAHWGGVHILVNCAGWDRPMPFVDTTPDFWEKILAINLKGPMACTRAALRHMIAQGAGKIVSIASDAGRVGSTGEAVYSAAKGGLIAFTKTIAREVARHRINVNCVCPGPSDTPLFQQEFAAASPRLAESLKRVIPWGRLGVPDDIAPAVVFLASDDAGFITGQTLSVSGGLTMV